MDFSIEAKYPIKIFQNNNLDYSWNTIKIGWDLKRLDLDEISKFAIDFVEEHPNLINEYISELIFGIKENEFDDLLEKIFKSLMFDFPTKKSFQWNQEWRKWRYCIMSEMVKQISDAPKLLVLIEGVYADFGYPEDMSHLIYYMPSNESKKQAQEACINLVKKVHGFLQEERKRIEGRCNILPRIIDLGPSDAQ